MHLPSKNLKRIALITGAKIEQYFRNVLDKSIHEEHLSLQLQTNIEQFKLAVNFLTGYNGIFNSVEKKQNLLVHKITY